MVVGVGESVGKGLSVGVLGSSCVGEMGAAQATKKASATRPQQRRITIGLL
jgi:hypothetical protein